MMGDDSRFITWYKTWHAARPDSDNAPIGWYVLADLETAFNAGRADMHTQTLDEILARTRALETLLRDPPAPE